MAKRCKKHSSPTKQPAPADQEKPKGSFPSVEHQFKPGQSGNPKGRPPAFGASVVEWTNIFDAQGMGEAELRAIARDVKERPSRRNAARRLLRTLEDPDMADIEPVLDGKLSLKELRKSGVNTTLIKKCKVKRRTLYGQDGPTGEEVEREVELRDTSGEEYDRVCDRTAGRPRQQVDVSNDDGSLRTAAQGAAKAAAILAGVRGRLGAHSGGAGGDTADT